MSRLDSDLLPEGLRLEGDRIVDAQDVPWVTFEPGGNGDPTQWRETIVEICRASLGASHDEPVPTVSSGTGLLYDDDVMPKPPSMYDFAIRFRNDRMGFTKGFSVQAQNAQAAVVLGQALLKDKNYDPAEFEAIEIIRGRQAGT